MLDKLMKKILLIIIIISSLLISGCGGLAHVNNEETREVCMPFCNKANMSVNMDHSLTYDNTIICRCEGLPILRPSILKEKSKGVNNE